MTRRKIAVAALLFSLALLAGTSFAQIATTSLRGVVKDPSGAVVPGAKITITNGANGQALSTVSNAAGEYTFPEIVPARYTIDATAQGFGNQKKVAELLVSQPATIDFSMSLQSVSQVVNVSAEAQTLNTTDASIGNSMGNAMIQSLPSEARNVPDLLSLQPGVVFLGSNMGRPTNPSAENDPRSGAVNGGRSDQGNITVDGVDDNDQVNGFAFTGVLRETQDSVEEFRVTTGNGGADEGRSSGAQVSLVTKSGSNKFHGAAYEYNRPTLTVANDYFNKQAELESGLPNTPPKLIRNNFGAAVGGPILRDKLFFFANYEGLRQAEDQVVQETTPTASFKAGILQYLTSPTAAAALSIGQVAQLDASCQVCGTAAYSPGPGPNPYALKYFNSMPTANGTAAGDGLNTGSFTFASPNPVTLNTTVGRIDFSPTQSQHIFVRGNLQKDTTGEVEQFPGQGPSRVDEDNSKGLTAGYTWTIRPTLVNDLRYGYVRQGFGRTGVGSGDYVDFRFLSTATAETRSTITSVPVNNIVDNLSWAKGKHTFQLGGNWRLVHYNHGTNANSFNNGSTNPSGLGGTTPDPATIGAQPVDGGFQESYQQAFANLVGTVSEVTNIYNYHIDSPTAGTLLADGAFITHHFKANEFEYYLQDSWRATSKITLTYGIRHSILQTPSETSGQEIAPTIDTHAWFVQREIAAQQGQTFEPNLQFSPTGSFYGKPGYWPKQKLNFAPRLSVAYAPDSKTSIRAGFGLYFDHYGESLVNTFDAKGSFGLSSQLTTPLGTYSIDGSARHPAAPRFTDNHTLPPIGPAGGGSTQAFPYTPPSGPADGFAVTWGLDSRLKTPYSESFDFSIQRQLPGGFSLEAAYYGRLGRHLLQNYDLAEPVDVVDTKGGGDYYTAGAQLSGITDQNGGDPGATVPAIKYFEDVFPFMANVDYLGESATQAIYSNEWAPYRGEFGATTAIADIDFYCGYGCPAGYQSQFWQGQFASLYALSTLGNSYYNSGQLVVRHSVGRGLQLDFSYTYSHSIDMGSDPERGTEFGGGGGNFSNILNTWKPSLNRASSDYDVRHLITTDWVYALPFGKGKALASGAGTLLDNMIGGWQFTGVEHWNSGLPFAFVDPGWTTDWEVPNFATVTGKLHTHKNSDALGNVFAFDNPYQTINGGVATGSPVRFSYPGEAGQRNVFRGDGYFDTDSGLDKNWKLGEYGGLKFAWEVFNVTNTVRFDPASIEDVLTQKTIGQYGNTLTSPRRMQFSLRYDF